METPGTIALLDALSTGTSLTSLDLKNSQFSSIDEPTWLANLIAKCSSLTYLNAAGNFLGDSGAEVVGKALADNPSLESLVLEDNDIGVEGAKHIARALTTNDTLRMLSLDENEIGLEGMQMLSDVLLKNTSMVVLDLTSCSEDDMVSFVVAIIVAFQKWILESGRNLCCEIPNRARNDFVETTWHISLHLGSVPSGNRSVLAAESGTAA